MYFDILELKAVEDPQRRGYSFEHAVRELLPWDLRPPIAARARSEQFDAIFQWAGSQYIVEAKAKKGRIDLGSSDWEDFELKVRRRPHCIGLFLSLFDVDQNIVSRAMNLNESGSTIVLIFGSTWDDLEEHHVDFQEYLRYLVFNARTNHRPDETNFHRYLAWANDTGIFLDRVNSSLKKFSAPFVRRYRHPKHDAIYVTRQIDKFITDITRELAPRTLMDKTKRKAANGQLVETQRAAPKQFCIIKDYSGSGKTTLGVQIVGEKERYFGFGAAARQSNIDCHEEVLSSIGPNYGLRALIHLNKPVIFFVNSLDEAGFMPGKRDEVLSIIKSLYRLNESARRIGLIAFPICFVFTVRFEYWRDWESVFEGLNSHQASRRFSYFTHDETIEALNKYSETYDFSIAGLLNEESLRVLSHPFNMLIFAEANEYHGKVAAVEVLSETVLSLYFDRKKEELLKRPTVSFDAIKFMRLCSELAAQVVLRASNSVSISDLHKLVLGLDRSLEYHVNQILQTILSEQIIVRDSENTDTYRFRHIRFIEYLLAYFLADELSRKPDVQYLTELVDRYFKGDFASIYNVHEFLRSIRTREFPALKGVLLDYYGSSVKYTTRLLNLSRIKIGEGETLPERELAIVARSVATGDEEICWESFFVLAAKNNAVPREKVNNAFVAAWRTSANGRNKMQRKKLIRKMADLGWLLEEVVVLSVFNSENYDEWLSLFDEADRKKLIRSLLEIWNERDGAAALKKLVDRKVVGFEETRRVIALVVEKRNYPRGEMVVGEVDRC